MFESPGFSSNTLDDWLVRIDPNRYTLDPWYVLLCFRNSTYRTAHHNTKHKINCIAFFEGGEVDSRLFFCCFSETKLTSFIWPQNQLPIRGKRWSECMCAHTHTHLILDDQHRINRIFSPETRRDTRLLWLPPQN